MKCVIQQQPEGGRHITLRGRDAPAAAAAAAAAPAFISFRQQQLDNAHHSEVLPMLQNTYTEQ
jgi:hypothetical protein